MYTPVAVRLLGESEFSRDGHCYDVSESGVQFELDEPLPPGTPVEVRLELPGDIDDHQRPVRALANIVWQDQSEPGPTRMAATFTRFSNMADRQRLFARITSGQLVRAA